MKAGESDIVRRLLNALKDAPSAANVQPPERIYTVQEASSALSALVDEAIEGAPQFIRKSGDARVIVIAEHMVADMLGRMGPRSFADMFPVTETEPPLGELKVRERPGRSKARLD